MSIHETSITLMHNVDAKIIRPQETKAAVLLLHGFQDDMDGVAGLQKELGQALMRQGIASLRLNFRGEGARENYVATSTMKDRLEDAGHGYEYLKNEFPNHPIGVLGWSLGGLTAMVLAGQNPQWFDSMVIWSGAGNGMILIISNEPEYNKIIRTVVEKGKATWKKWETMTMTKRFLLGLLGYEALEWLPKYSGAFFSIRGDKDYLPQHDNQWLDATMSQDKLFIEMKDADHLFNVLDEVHTKRKEVTSLTVRWFVRTLSESP